MRVLPGAVLGDFRIAAAGLRVAEFRDALLSREVPWYTRRMLSGEPLIFTSVDEIPAEAVTEPRVAPFVTLLVRTQRGRREAKGPPSVGSTRVNGWIRFPATEAALGLFKSRR